MNNENANAVLDIFDVLFNEDKKDSNDKAGTMSASKALITCLNERHEVDMYYLEELSGLLASDLAVELEGAIFQQPEMFENGEEYDVYEGWVISPRYLSGNIRAKYKTATAMNSKYRGVFQSNVNALMKLLPEKVGIDDIHLGLGASWIPKEEIEIFLCSFLNLNQAPEVLYFKDLNSYKIVSTAEAKNSILNTITYGVRGEISEYGSTSTKQYYTAIDIIEQTLNAKNVKVYDYVPRRSSKSRDFEYEAVFNKAKTVEAQAKQKAILDGFKDYVYSDQRIISAFEDYYNTAMVGYTYTAYNGSFLKLEGLNPDVTLYKHQKDAIARVLLSDENVLFAHDVGSGKTYEMIISLHELYHHGMSQKNLVVVPNNVLEATATAHRFLYKDDKILVVYPKDFGPADRNNVLEEIRDGDYVAIYMAYSSFDMITMSKQYYVNKYSNEISKLRMAKTNATNVHEQHALESHEKSLAKKLEKYIEEEIESPFISFDSLGIETLVVDEAHNYKNIGVVTKADGIVGLSKSASKKNREMLEKSRFVGRLIFSTGTPLTNSLADLFVFQTYLQHETLKFHGLDTFDMWVNTFSQRETTIECDVDANSKSLRTMTRFSSFHNLAELMSLFSQVCDFHHTPKGEEGLPSFNGYIDIIVPKNEYQEKYINNLSKRVERIRKKLVARDEDNLLKVTTEGRMAALDIRLVDKKARYSYIKQNKITICADKVFELYQKYPDSCQIVFSDIGTPKDSFNVYDELAYCLTEHGIPRHQIAFVHDAVSEKARAKLFADMNKGILKVVIGSTSKLGVGVNVQERLVALHHLSVPWRPADMVQREGRIIRRGNTSEEVFIYRYITEETFDAYSWQILENKQRFISSFLSGTSAAREMEDVADTVLTYAEVKALAIGNPLIKQRVETANKLERVKINSRSRQKELQHLCVVKATLPKKIKKLKNLSQIAHDDYTAYQENKEKIPNSERIAFGEELLLALDSNINMRAERVFETYQGFDVCLPASMMAERRYVLIRSKNGGEYYCEMDSDKTPLGCTKAVDYLLDHLDERSNNFKKEATDVEQQLKDAEVQFEKGNEFLKIVEALTEELQIIDEELEKSEAEA